MDKNRNRTENFISSFAGANTERGFVSYYSIILREKELDGLYVIKGGPGTGKSTFMKRLADEAMAKGYDSECFLCGSDENSLDCITIKNGKKKVGVLDGTLPHPMELRYPGAVGKILDFGMFWDESSLRRSRGDIEKFSESKSAAFDTAYRYLGAAGKIEHHIYKMASEMYLKEKGSTFAGRIVRENGGKGRVIHKQLRGITMNGDVMISPRCTGKIRDFIICGDENVGGVILNDIYNAARAVGAEAEISMSPINSECIDSIFFGNSSVWIRFDNDFEGEAEKIINTRRFIDKDKQSLCRQKMRFGKKCRKSLLDGAMDSLKTAKNNHFVLEGIYSKHMDFKALEKQSEIWYREILSLLD